jgi:hypothetical protein
MNKHFGTGKKNKVVRQLPGKGRDAVSYEYTDVDVAVGPKFAFYVMESRKSYTVTSDPVYGGTICYVPFATEDEAHKLKLFVEKNPVYAEYVKRMKLRGHAFGLRNMRKFDINQIVTGLETPKEWTITAADLLPPTVLENNITEDRNRVKALGEVFTPTPLVDYVLDLLEQHDTTALTAPSNTFIDSMCGDGQFLVGVKNRKLINGIDNATAISTIYGIDLTQENVDKIMKEKTDTELELDILMKTSLEQIWLNELQILNKEYDSYRSYRQSIQNSSTEKKKIVKKIAKK